MPRRILSGVVLNTREKTARVKVTRIVKHNKYGKIIKLTRNYLVHDENNVAKPGENITFAECPPKSKLKAWEIIEKESAQSA